MFFLFFPFTVHFLHVDTFHIALSNQSVVVWKMKQTTYFETKPKSIERKSTELNKLSYSWFVITRCCAYTQTHFYFSNVIYFLFFSSFILNWQNEVLKPSISLYSSARFQPLLSYYFLSVFSALQGDMWVEKIKIKCTHRNINQVPI